MKQLGITVFLILTACAGVFAEGFTWSGSFRTGVTAGIPQRGESDVRLETDDGYGTTAARLRLVGAYEQSAWGLRFRLQGNVNTGYSYGFNEADQYASLWMAFLKDRIRVSAGKIEGNTWNVPFETAWGLDARAGLRVEIKPINGLSFGGTLKIPPLGTDEWGKFTAERLFNEAIVGARWETPWFMAVGAFEFDGYDNYRNDEQTLIAGFTLKCIPNFLLAAEGRLENLLSGQMTYHLAERFGYPINPLSNWIVRVYEDGRQGNGLVNIEFNPEVNIWLTGRFQPACELILGGAAENLRGTAYTGIKPKGLWKISSRLSVSFYYIMEYIWGADLVRPQRGEKRPVTEGLNHTLNLSVECSF